MNSLLVPIVLCLVFSGWGRATAGGLTAPNGLGVFFSETEFTSETTNLDVNGQQALAYIVLINADVEAVSGYTCGVRFTDPALVFVNSVTGSHGWSNQGTNTNQIVNMDLPGKPVARDGSVVLCTMTVTSFSGETNAIELGPATPRGLESWDGPTIRGVTADDLRPAFLTSGVSGAGFQAVATINGAGVTDTRDHSLTRIKSLFR